MTWNWERIDERSMKRALHFKPSSLHVTEDDVSGEFDGAKGIVYSATLHSCSCPDFIFHKRKQSPCKHMLRLALEAQIINKHGRTPKQQTEWEINDLKNRIAIAAGYYFVFHERTISDEKYDRMKRRYLELCRASISSAALDSMAHQSLIPSVFSDVEQFIESLNLLNISYVDKRSSGGCFWVESRSDIDGYLSLVSVNGKQMKKADKSRTLKSQPGWYLPSV